MFDGDPETIWHCSKSSPCHFTLDFGGIRKMLAIRLLSVQHAADTVIVQTKTNLTDEWELYEQLSVEYDFLEKYFNNPRRARYAQFEVHSNHLAIYPKIRELLFVFESTIQCYFPII